MVLAPGLGTEARGRLERAAASAGVATTGEPLSLALRNVAVAVVCSGTATLECAAVGVPPVIVYRTDPLTFAVARRMVRVPHVGLPNLVLGRRAFPELVQDAASPEGITGRVQDVLGELGPARATCDEVRTALLCDVPPAEAVAKILEPWLT